MSALSEEAFFLYAETYFSEVESRDANLAALALCAKGTSRLTPSVATYVFRPSDLARQAGPPRFPDAQAIESTELYLTHAGFRDHLTTDEFRAGLRTMYKNVKRLGARIFWIGRRPPSDILHNIFRSDPHARPAATLVEKLFDESVYRSAPAEDHLIISVMCRLSPGAGAAAADALDSLDAAARTVSLVGFFHPHSSETLRIFLIAPVNAHQSAQDIAAALRPLDALPMAGHNFASARLHATKADTAAALRAALAESVFEWDIQAGGHEGYILHPATVARD